MRSNPTYEKFAKIIGPDLLRVVEQNLGGKYLRIRKYAKRIDAAHYAGRPLTIHAIMEIFGKSHRQAIRIKKILQGK
jgi:hypothetical protein